MKVGTCLKCRRLFSNPYDRELCPECSKVEEERFERVRRYIKKNDKCGVEEVSEACGISKRQILKWVREERLYFAEDSGVGVPCMNCGTIINTGKYCNSCRADMQRTMASVYVEPKEDEVIVKKTKSSRMRFMNKDKK